MLDFLKEDNMGGGRMDCNGETVSVKKRIMKDRNFPQCLIRNLNKMEKGEYFFFLLLVFL